MGKHFLRTQNVFEKIQKHFLRLGRKFCIHNKINVACVRKQGNIWFRNNVSSFVGAFIHYWMMPKWAKYCGIPNKIKSDQSPESFRKCLRTLGLQNSMQHSHSVL